MKKLKGIRRVGNKWEVYVRVAGKFRSATFATLDVVAMRAWQERERSLIAPPPARGTFRADVATYLALPQIAAMSPASGRAAHLDLWLAALGGDRPRSSITREDVERVLQQWLAEGYAEATVFHRRTALSAVFTTLDGPSAANPVRGTTRPAPWTPRDQSVPRDVLVKVVAAMGETRMIAPGIRQPATARLVSRVLMETGVRGADLLKVQRHDVDFARGTITMPRSKKGKGAASWVCRLTPEGLQAMRDFDAAGLYGAFSLDAVAHSFKRAARRVLGPQTRVHLYALRHSVGADLYRLTRDIATVARLLGHTAGSIVTEQYARGAHEDVDRAALAALTQARAAAAGPTPGPQLGAKLGRSRKSHEIKHFQSA